MLAAALLVPPLAAVRADAARPATLQELLATTPGDSLAAPLRRFEQEHARGPEAADASLLLGEYHFARGEYRQAGDAFARAAARLAPTRKAEARYWAGLCALATKQPENARAVLEEVAQSGSPRRREALLGVALAWEMGGRDDRALDQIESLLETDAGEAGPAALEHGAALAARAGRRDLARRYTERLLKQYPESIEAARVQPVQAAVAGPAPAATGSGGSEVQIGAFADPARARALAESARRAGFPSASVTARGSGANRIYAVRLGSYSSREEARRAGERAAGALGVSYRLVKPQ